MSRWPVAGVMVFFCSVGCARSGYGTGDSGARLEDAVPSDSDRGVGDGGEDSAKNDDSGCSFAPRCVEQRIERCVNGRPQSEACPLGCAAVPPTCRELLPSNVGGRVDLKDHDVVVVVGAETHANWVFNTSDGSIVAYDALGSSSPERQTVRPAGIGKDATSGIAFDELVATEGKSYGVFALGSLVVPNNTAVAGIGGRPLVVLARNSITVDGLVSVGAARVFGVGPGAGGHPGGATCPTPGQGPGGGISGTTKGHGGGGGSYGGKGGASGDVASQAGPVYGEVALAPLLGGSGGASGHDTDCGRGGAGGGALQLSAGIRLTLSSSGRIGARGEGGRRGGWGSGGGGGGSGGAILVEAPEVVLEGALGVNGGSGGGSYSHGDGQHGSIAEAPARADTSAGDGSDAQGVAKPGAPVHTCNQSSCSGGGGGGSGRIRINTAGGNEKFDRAIILPTLTSKLTTVGQVAWAP